MTIRIDESCGKMGVHLPPGAVRIMTRVRIGIELREEFLDGRRPGGKRKGLIPVIAGIEITRLKEFRHGHLRHFLSISENAKFRLPR